MPLLDLWLQSLALLTWLTLTRIPGATSLCDPVSQRMIDPVTDAPLPDGSVCPAGQYCQGPTPPSDPPRGDCAAKAPPDSPCTINAGCQPGTAIEGNKFVCSKKPGESSGTCGCLHDYLTQQEKDERQLETGFSWTRAGGGQGCVKSVLQRRPCNARTDVCSGGDELECRPRDGKSGDSFCLFPFGSRDAEAECYDASDCRDPYSCEVAKGKGKCDCLPGTKKDPNVDHNCILRYVGFLIQCTDDTDCLPEWKIECHPTTKVCDCVAGGGHEHFPQINGQDRCYPTFEHGNPCINDIVLTQTGPEHNCRRKNKDGIVTNLQCVGGTCICEENHFDYDAVTTQTCQQLHAWHGEPCDSNSEGPGSKGIDRYQCDSKLSLMCSDTFKCECIPGADLLPNKKKACKLRSTYLGMGESCDGKSLLCDPDLHLACTAGKCACVVDESIVQEGAFCRFTNYHRKLSSAASALTALSIVLKYLPLLALLID